MKKAALFLWSMLIYFNTSAQYMTEYHANRGVRVNGQCVLKYGSNLLVIIAEDTKITLAEINKTDGAILRTRTIFTNNEAVYYPEITAALVDSDNKIAMAGFSEDNSGKSTAVFFRFDFETDVLFYGKYLYETKYIQKYSFKGFTGIRENTNRQTYELINATGFSCSVDKTTGNISGAHFQGAANEYLLYGKKDDDKYTYTYGAWIKKNFSSRYPVLTKYDNARNIIFSETFIQDTAQTEEHFYGNATQILPTKSALYLAATTSNYNVDGGTYIYLLKCTETGSLLWTRKYNFSLADDVKQIWTMNELPGGDILTSGMASSGATFLMRLDTAGNIRWSNFYNFSVDDRGQYQNPKTRQYLLVDGHDVYMAGVNASGIAFPDGTLTMVNTGDGILPGCYTALNITVTKEPNMVTNVPVEILKSRTASAMQNRVPAASNINQVAAHQCPDAVVAASENSTINAAKKEGFEVKVFPNPATNILVVQTKLSGVKTIDIYSSEGRMVESFTTPAGSLSVLLRNYVTGMYFVKILAEKGDSYVSKIFVVK